MGNRSFVLCALMSLLAFPVLAGNHEWTSGWGMGVSEFHVSDGSGNEILISCPNEIEDGYVSATVILFGERYGSDLSAQSQFDVVVDGKLYLNPFYTDCRVCGEIFRDFWEDFRNAGTLDIIAGDRKVSFPVNGLKSSLPSLNSVENPCKSSW